MKKYILNAILIVFLLGCAKQNKNGWTLYDIYPDFKHGKKEDIKKAISRTRGIKEQGVKNTSLRITNDSIFLDTDNELVLNLHLYMEYAYTRKSDDINIEYG